MAEVLSGLFDVSEKVSKQAPKMRRCFSYRNSYNRESSERSLQNVTIEKFGGDYSPAFPGLPNTQEISNDFDVQRLSDSLSIGSFVTEDSDKIRTGTTRYYVCL